MIEDTVFGPFTIKQFLFIGSGAALIMLARMFFEPFLFYPIAFLLAATAGGFAFLKINGQPLPIVTRNAILFLFRPRLYTWRQEARAPKKPSETKKREPTINRIPTIAESKITDLAWSLDIKTKRE